MTTEFGATDLWVFGYGSLIWRPGFAFEESVQARLHGYHRSLCVFSHVHRGTPERPGLVLGLDRGGSCRGRALRVAAADWPRIRAMLDDRELVTGVYHPRFLPLRLDDGRRVAAYAYVANRDHGQYWSGTAGQAVALIRQGHGACGAARDYLADCVRHLADLGMADHALRRLLDQVDRGG